jgi:SAM-dependent methyltransferase
MHRICAAACSESEQLLRLRLQVVESAIRRIPVPDVFWNRGVWGSTYHWPAGGEEWSRAWGGSEAQWFGSIFPRLHRFLPAQRILEIAPGFGRWTKFLIPACEEFVGIDLSEKCTDACRKSFAEVKQASFFTNDGHSLAAAQDRSFDLVFSFDSLVHAEHGVMNSYLPQSLSKLSPVGVAFIHHSNLHAYGNTIENPHARATTISADMVADMITHNGGSVLIQKIVNWGGDHLIDCLTLFSRRETYPFSEPIRLNNPVFMAEARLIQSFQSHYSSL